MILARGLFSLAMAFCALPSAGARAALRNALRIERSLPEWFVALALPELMRRLDTESANLPLAVDATNALRLADAAAGLDYYSPLGICLRRSLVRYVLLRRADLPVVVQFGAKKHANDGRSRIAGHAWLTLDGQPYAEDPRDYAGFTSIYAYPPSGADCGPGEMSSGQAGNSLVNLSNLKSKI